MTTPQSAPQPGSCKSRLCIVCGNPIPLQRLEAKPNTKHCVSCLEAQGDVPKLRRYDEFDKHGEEVCQTYFTEDRFLNERVTRIQKEPLPILALEQAVGDDSSVARDGSSVESVNGIDAACIQDETASELDPHPIRDMQPPLEPAGVPGITLIRDRQKRHEAFLRSNNKITLREGFEKQYAA